MSLVKNEALAEEKFIVVLDPIENEPVEIPASADDTLRLAELEHTFPGAYGLKYKNPSTGAKRVVSFDESRKCFLPPAGGWANKQFEMVFRQPTNQPTNNNLTATSEKSNKDIVVKEENIGESRTSKRKHDEPLVYESEKVVVYEDRVVDNNKLRDNNDSTGYEERDDHRKGLLNKKGDDDSFAGKSSKKLKHGGGEIKIDKECCDLIVIGLPFDLDEWALKQYFDKFGEVKSKEIKRKKNGTSRGFGFVQMVNYSDQVQVLSVPKHMIGGRECVVRIASDDRGINSLKNISTKPRLHISGLDIGIDRERLRDFFSDHLRRFDKFAEITDMYYPKSRGFAFITISSASAAREMTRQRDFIMDGCRCEVTFAMPKKEDDIGMQPWANLPPKQTAPAFPAQPAQQNIHQYGGYPAYPDAGPWAGTGSSVHQQKRLPVQFDDYDYQLMAQKESRLIQQYQHMSQAPFEPMYHTTNDYLPPNRGQSPAQHHLDFDPRAAGIRGGPSVPASYHHYQQPVRSRHDVWENVDNRSPSNLGGAGGVSMSRSGAVPNYSADQAEAVLNMLPVDAVGTALHMLQAIMSNKQQQQGEERRRDSESRGGAGGGGDN